MSITILNPGTLTSVQDLGRIGYQQYGVSVSGVMDPRSASIANILVDKFGIAGIGTVEDDIALFFGE